MFARKTIALVLLPLSLSLSACGSQQQEDNESAQDFASRIDGKVPAGAADASNTANGPRTAATTAAVQEGAAPGPYEAGTQTDPRSVKCGATESAFAVGETYDAALGQRIADAAPGPVRVVQPGSATTQDYVAQRLNVMLDSGGVVRDLRCG